MLYFSTATKLKSYLKLNEGILTRGEIVGLFCS